MKILAVAPWVPGQVRPRSHGLLRLLAAEHEVRLIALYSDEAELSQYEAIEGVETVFLPNPRLPAVGRAGIALIRGTSLQSAYGRVAELRAEVRGSVASWRPDVLHLNVFRTAFLGADAGTADVVIDLDEFRSEYYRQLSHSSSAFRRFVGRHEHPGMAAQERALLRTKAEILVSSPDEGARVQSPNVHVVRTPVWPIAPQVAAQKAIDVRLLFVGRLSYEANVEGLAEFVEAAWPLIRSRHPSATLDVVGAHPTRQIRRLAADPSVRLHLDVPSVGGFYAGATAAIVPIERATGIQMKLIQAAAAGVPAIVSPLVSKLAGTTPGRNVLVASTPLDWAECVDALATGGLRDRVRDEGRRWYEANHDPAAVRRQLESVYQRLVVGGQPAAGVPAMPR